MNLDPGPAFDWARTVVHGPDAAIPNIIMALVVSGAFLVAHGIDLPFPARQILFHDQTDDIGADRGRQREGWPAGQAHVPASRRVADVIAQISESASREVAGE